MYLVILGLIVVTSGASVPDINTNVLGGTETAPGEFPYMALMVLNGKRWCAATIVDSHHVISSGRCVRNQINRTEQLQISVNVRNASNPTENGSELYEVDNWIVHPKYEFRYNIYEYDIVLIRLKSEIKFSDTVGPVTLAEPDDGDFTDVRATVPG